MYGMNALTKAQRRALEHAAHCAKFGWAFATGQSVTKKAVDALVQKGLVRDAGEAAMVDGDGFTIQPERWRQCWELTDEGRRVVEAIWADEKRGLEALMGESARATK